MIDHAEAIRMSLFYRLTARNAVRNGETEASKGDVSALRRWLQTARMAMRRAVEAFKAARLTGHYVSTAGGWLAVVRSVDGTVATVLAHVYGKRQSAQRAAKREAAYHMGLATTHAHAWIEQNA